MGDWRIHGDEDFLKKPYCMKSSFLNFGKRLIAKRMLFSAYKKRCRELCKNDGKRLSIEFDKETKMAKVILICGKICSGKSTYAEQMRVQNHAALLSVDEITLALFGQHCGDKHDDYVERTQNYLFDKSLELIEAGINVVLDWGFWMKEERDYAREFYNGRNIECEFHYIDISDETWKARLMKRNSAILAEETSAYYVDDNLAAKFGALFEKPSRDEIDVWVEQ